MQRGREGGEGYMLCIDHDDMQRLTSSSFFLSSLQLWNLANRQITNPAMPPKEIRKTSIDSHSLTTHTHPCTHTNQVYSPSSSEIQYIKSLAKAQRRTAIITTLCLIVEAVLWVSTKPIRRESVALVRPDDPCNNRMDNTLEPPSI